MKMPFYGLIAAIFSLVGISIGCSKKENGHFGAHPTDGEHRGKNPNEGFGPTPGDGLWDTKGEN